MRAWFVLLFFVACSSPGAKRTEPFLAFGTDFTGFRGWPSWTPAWAFPGNDHLSGPRVVYFSERPAEGAREFPVGTMIVKESGDGALETRHVFAMVKRGGGYNATGAKGWEWFELTNVDEKQSAIAWRGVGPTNGDAYGGDATGGCNLCHGSAEATDFVFSAHELGLK